MNICFFYSHPLFQAKGGTERVSILLRDEFERRGHSVSFLAFAENQASVENFAQFYIKKETAQSGLESFVREKKINFFIYQDGAVPIPFEIPQNLGCRLVVVLHYSPDFYTNDYWKIFLEARLPRPLKFLAAFFEKTLLNSLGLALLRRRIGWVYAASLRSCSAFVLLSERFCPDLEKLLGKSVPTDAHKKIHAIPNPSVPASLPQGTSKKKELLFVGRLKNNQKRVDLLLKIWARLEKDFPEWVLRIVGDGQDSSGLRSLAKTLGLERVAFEGFQKPEPFYRDAAIFCMTSAYEGFPMVLVEAAAFGCVPVAFDSFAAVHDIIADGENGRIVPAFDLDKYAETLAELMSDSALRERLSKNAIRIPEKFSIEEIGQKWTTLFEKITQQTNLNS